MDVDPLSVSVAEWGERWPAEKKVLGSIPRPKRFDCAQPAIGKITLSLDVVPPSVSVAVWRERWPTKKKVLGSISKPKYFLLTYIPDGRITLSLNQKLAGSGAVAQLAEQW